HVEVEALSHVEDQELLPFGVVRQGQPGPWERLVLLLLVLIEERGGGLNLPQRQEPGLGADRALRREVEADAVHPLEKAEQVVRRLEPGMPRLPAADLDGSDRRGKLMRAGLDGIVVGDLLQEGLGLHCRVRPWYPKKRGVTKRNVDRGDTAATPRRWSGMPFA